MEVKLRELNLIMEGTDALYHEAAKRLGVSNAEMTILYMLYEYGEGCPQKDLYKHTGISKSTINSALKSMEKEEYIYLTALDGRSTGIYFTDKGKDLMKRTAERIVEIENLIFDSWSEEDRKNVIRLNREYMEKLAVYVKEL